jgi:hypothetical protein
MKATTIDAVALLQVHLQGQAVRSVELHPAVPHRLLGRSPECDIVLAHPSVSRRHARLSAASGRWEVEDLDSANGLRVEGVPTTRCVLKDGAWLAFGDVFCRFRLGVRDAAAAAAGAGDGWRGRLRAAEHQDAVLGTLLAGAVELSGCRRGLLLAGDGDTAFTTVASFGLPPEQLSEAAFQGSRGVLARCIAERAPVLVHDPALFEWAGSRHSVVQRGLRAMLALPLLDGDRLLGVLYADSDAPGKAFGDLDVQLLEGLTAEAAQVLHARGIDAALSRIARCLDVDASGAATGLMAATVWRP